MSNATKVMKFYSDYKKDREPLTPTISKAVVIPSRVRVMDFEFEHLSPLHGAVCVDIVKNSEPEIAYSRDDEYGLVFKCRDGKVRTAWIMRDPEGNGAGHLDIV